MSEAAPISRLMLFQAIGTPSSLAYGSFALLQTLVNVVHGDHFLIQAMYVEDVKTRWASLDHTALKPVIVVSDCPSSGLTRLLVATNLPALVIIDDFVECVAHALTTRAMALPEALRFLTQCYCALGACKAQEKLTIRRRDLDQPIGEVLRRFALHFGLGSPDDAASRTLAALHRTGDQPFRSYIAGLWPEPPIPEAATRDPEQSSIVAPLAQPYEAVAQGQDAVRITWPTQTFLDWGRPGQFLRGPVVLDGPARFIICGPYFHLPAGEWTAEVVIQIEGNLSGNRLTVDIFSGDIVGGVTAFLPPVGFYKFAVPFKLADPFVSVELRFQTVQGAIEGRLSLLNVSFSRPVELAASDR